MYKVEHHFETETFIWKLHFNLYDLSDQTGTFLNALICNFNIVIFLNFIKPIISIDYRPKSPENQFTFVFFQHRDLFEIPKTW